jgi:hypothetical protein
MNMLKTLAVLALGSAFLAGCAADKDESAAETETPAPVVDTPAASPTDEMAPADSTEGQPSDEPDSAISDTLPTTDEPPPPEPAPPPG